MSKKEITSLSESFLSAFNDKVKYALKEDIKSEIEMLEHDMNVLHTKLMAARNGGAGNVAKLHEQKILLARKLQEAKASRSADSAEGDTKRPSVEVNVKTPQGTADKESPKRKGDLAQADSMEKIKENAELDEAKLPVAKIQKMVDDGKSMDVIVGTFANKRTTNTDEIRQVVKDYMWKKRMKKEDIEITELHMSLLEAHGIEKKMAERIKKVFDAMSTEDKAAFMKSYLKNPKAATEYMANSIMKGVKAAGGMNMKEEAELDEEAQPKWKVQIGKKHYTVTARNTSEANQKAKKLAAKDGNSGVGGSIERINEALDPVNPKELKGKHSERKDKDIDNDGDIDSSDEYLHKRRQAISKALAKEEADTHKTKDGRTAKKGLWYNINKKKERGEKPLAKGHPDRPTNQDFKDARKTTKEETEDDRIQRSLSGHKVKQDAKVKAGIPLRKPGEGLAAYVTRKAKAQAKMQKEEVELDESRIKAVGGDRAAKVGKATDPSERRVPKRGTKAYDEWMKKNAERRKAELAKQRNEEVELDEAKKLSTSDFAKIVAQRLDSQKSKIHRYDQIAAIKKAINATPQKNLATDREFIDDILDILYDKHNFREEVELDEAKGDYTINHKTFSSAVQHAKAQVEKQGYTFDDDEWDRKVAMGPKKPGTGKTNRYTIDLMKGGKESRRKLQMQVYYDEGRYELNMYVS